MYVQVGDGKFQYTRKGRYTCNVIQVLCCIDFLGPIYFIIGGVVGGILLIVISTAMVILFCICKRYCAQKKKRKSKILY